MSTATRPLTCILVVVLSICALVGAWPLPTARADTLIVNSKLDSGPGSLRQAIANAESGDTITFNLAPYPATITLQNGELLIDKDLTIQGPGRDNLTIAIHPDHPSRILAISAGIVEISHLTITKGKRTGVPALGGCIHNTANLTLAHVKISDCQAIGLSGGGTASGGAIANEDTLNVEDSIITDNVAQGGPSGAGAVPGGSALGGGIGNLDNAWLIIKRTTVANNQAIASTAGSPAGLAHGGALYGGYNTRQFVTDCLIESNLAYGGDSDSGTAGNAFGGGISGDGLLVVEGSAIRDNTAQGGSGRLAGHGYGGGIGNHDKTTIEDSELSGNLAKGGNGTGGGTGGLGHGGGLQDYDAELLSVTNTTIRDNTAQGGQHSETIPGRAHGGGFATLSTSTQNGKITFLNCTFSSNRAISDEDSRGGGLFVGTDTDARLSFCTVASNEADKGGGIYSNTSDDNNGPIVKNTIIGDNTAGEGQQIYRMVQSRGYNLIESLEGGDLDISGNDNTGTGNRILVEPRIGPLQDNGGPSMPDGGAPWTHDLLRGDDPSEAIDNGTDTDIEVTAINFDQRSMDRPFGGGHDIGAVEAIPVDLAVAKSVSPDEAQPLQAVTYTISLANSGPVTATGILLTDVLDPSLADAVRIGGSLSVTDTDTSPPVVWQVQDLPPGQNGTLTVRATLTAGLVAGHVFTNTVVATTTQQDSDSSDNRASVPVSILNAPPIAVDDRYPMEADATLNVTAPGVLLNDLDANGDTLQAIKDSDPVSGDLNLNADGSFSYKPPSGFRGYATFTYHATDSTASSDEAIVTIGIGLDRVFLPIVLRNH